MQGYEKFFKQAREVKNDGPTRIKATPPKTKMRASQKPAESPEAAIKKLMQERVKAKKEQVKRKKAPFPKTAFAIVVVGTVLAGVGLAMPQTYEWITSHVEIGFLGEANAADNAKETKKDAEKPAKNSADAKSAGENSAATDSTAATQSMPDTRQWTEEETSFFNKLSERKRELDLKEAELAKLEEELQKQRLELDEKIKQLEAMRGQIAQTLKSRVDNDQAKVTKLVEVYSGMKPQQAAKVIETINEDLAVQVLDRMKKKNASDILNVMNAQKAQRLSEMLAGYKRIE